MIFAQDTTDRMRLNKLDAPFPVVQTTVYATTMAVPHKLGVKLKIGFDTNSMPTVGRLQELRVARAHSVRGSRIEKKAVPYPSQDIEDELILAVLGAHRRERREWLNALERHGGRELTPLDGEPFRDSSGWWTSAARSP
jgi:hypothetical protein